MQCSYRDIPPHKHDRTTLALEAKFESLQRDVAGVKGDISNLHHMHCDTSEKMSRLLQVCETQQNDIRLMREQLSSSTRATVSTPYQSTAVWPTSQAPTVGIQSETMLAQSNPLNPMDAMKVNSEATNSLPHNHTTAAQNLLLWPTIVAFNLEPNPDYVVIEEENRGVIRLYGRGEGRDKTDGSQGTRSPAPSSTSSRADDSPSPPAESNWGYGLKPPNPSSHGPHGDHPGGLNPDGTPNYAPELVDKYFESYMKHMYILHPFLDKKVLKEHVNQFKSRYSPGRQGLSRKRKHEDNSPVPALESYGPPLIQNSVGVERSIKNAIVLLVLALGKICDHKTPLPAPPPSLSPGAMQTSVPTPRSSNSDTLSPTPGSPYQVFGSKSRPLVASMSDRYEHEKMNVDVIPGLAYYNVACDILGGFRGAYDLSHVQAALLAGLYMGQLAHVHASHDWLTQAGKACQVLIDQ